MSEHHRDLALLGARAGEALCGRDLGPAAFGEAARLLLAGLSPQAGQVRIYLVDSGAEMMIEEALADPFGTMEGSDRIPLYQLPAALIETHSEGNFVRGEGGELLLPLRTRGELVGMVVLAGPDGRENSLDGFELKPLVPPLALGVASVLEARHARHVVSLLGAVTRMSRSLQTLEEPDRIAETFVRMAVDELGFDRATFVVFEEDGKSVRKAICARAGGWIGNLTVPPHVPRLGRKPQAHPHLPGTWIPLRMGSRLLGAVFVDNVYTLAPPPEDAAQALADLTGQVALALENARLFARVRHLALRDDLTGLYRPGYFEERAEEELANARRRGDRTGLFLIDIDHFKSINDTWGHPIGDEALRAVADRIRSILRLGDIASRKGGDEFAILVPGLDPAGGYTMCQRLLEGVHAHPVDLPGGERLSVTLSIGLALFPDHADDWNTLVQHADEALYRSKQDGRSRATCWNLDSPVQVVIPHACVPEPPV